MCSIPGLPTPGSEVSVLITRVTLNPDCGLVELWVNMGDDKKHIYEQMREEIQIPQRKFNEAEGKAADLCLVCISGTWHRARIVSGQGENYNVYLIDQGQPHSTTSEDLAWGQSDSFLLPPEIESCILANVLSLEKTWPERATKFLKSLHGKTLKGQVQHVLMTDRIILLDIPVTSKHMCKLGVARKVPAEEFKYLVQERIHALKGMAPEFHTKAHEQNMNRSRQLEKISQYFYPELSTEIYETVIVTEVTSPESVFCSLQSLFKAVKTLSDEIHEHYDARSDFGEAQPQTCGTACASRGKDGRWHRSLLKQNMTSNGSVEVFHVDQGKTELVPVGDIKPLHERFLKMPVFTYCCSLDGVKNNRTGWTTEQTDYMKSLLLNQTLCAKFNHHDKLQDVYNVSLYSPDGECITTHFMKQAGLHPPLKTKKDSDLLNGPIAPVGSFVHSSGDKLCIDFTNVNSNGLPEERMLRTKNFEVNCKTDEVDTSSTDIDSKENSEHSEPAMPRNMHLSGLNFFIQDPDGYVDAHTPGRHINVKVSCIESLQKFWCQIADSKESLQLLMQELQNHYASDHPQPLVESICVARNPDNNMWYRARILASQYSPVVDVRFIDYGLTRTIPLRDVRPIDPAFLHLQAQAFQCCLDNQENSFTPTAVTETDTALAEFQKFLVSDASLNNGLKCVVKAVTQDEEGLPLSVVDIETSTDSACKRLSQRCAQAESQAPVPSQVLSEEYTCSNHSIDVGGKEKVHVTAIENVHHFYCQLDRNTHLFERVMENVTQLISKQPCKDQQLGLDSICLARYTDGGWYRGQIVEMSPKLKVLFVDFGEILIVNNSDVRPFPNEASIARSAPVLAVPLGLHNVPSEVPQEVNQWFANLAIGCSLTISVVAKESNGKLIVDLFDGSVNVNMEVKERIFKTTHSKFSKGCDQQTNQQLSVSSRHTEPSEDYSAEKGASVSAFQEMTKEKVHNSGMYVRDGQNNSPQFPADIPATQCEHKMTLDEGAQPLFEITVGAKESVLAETLIQCDVETEKLFQPPSMTDIPATQVEHEMTLDEGTQPALGVVVEAKEPVLAETFVQSDLETTKHFLTSCPKENINTCKYKRPIISLNKIEEVYASCIVGPNYFWCQSTNTEDLNMVSKLAQEAGNTQLDVTFSSALGPGSPCLALFSSDNQWYRAQVLKRTETSLNVLFVDYGNESEVDIKYARPLPLTLLDQAPQAFLCSLSGFDESKGSWDDSAYDDFYNLLVDKPLTVTVFNAEDHPEIMTPQYSVQIECENVPVNDAMQKYWRTSALEHVERETPQIEKSVQDSSEEFKPTCLSVSKENENTCVYKRPNISKNKKEEVYASCIVDPHYFWCQFSNTEELDNIQTLVQMAAQAPQENKFQETLAPGSPCLALFSIDEQWYRAQVISRAKDVFHVLFTDYGNEADVNLKDVRPITQSLLDLAPRAFLCSLNGFDLSSGSWEDEVYDDFHSLLVDKLLILTVLSFEAHSEYPVPQYAVEIECEEVVVNATMQKYWKTIAKDSVSEDIPQIEAFPQTSQPESNTAHFNLYKGSVNTCMYKRPKVFKSSTEMVFASCIAEPHYFWCQFSNTEELSKVSQLAQEAGKDQQDTSFPQTLNTGSPCLALFSCDGNWYRAQVLSKANDVFHVLFIDYGNEADVNLKAVRPIPQNLLDLAPQAFLCSLYGFDVSNGSWDDSVYDDFYSLLVDKLLKLTVLGIEDHSDYPIPQYKVNIECDGGDVQTLMEKYWKKMKPDHALAEDQDEEDF